ncbi:MAG: hypothetical protein HZB67_00340 [Candidatus Aenigmarchaeota archaeon]|nr:hypothetical protein [Candidatus Aenigmarchaeota archaeon]
MKNMEELYHARVNVPGYVLGLHTDKLVETTGTVYKTGREHSMLGDVIVLDTCTSSAFPYKNGRVNPDIWLVLETDKLSVRDTTIDPVRYGMWAVQ